MSFPKDDNELDQVLADVFAPPPEADFETWQRQHCQAVAFLDPQRISAQIRKRTLMRRSVIIAMTAAVVACVWLGVLHFGTDEVGNAAFGQTVAQIEKAKTITWKQVYYEHISTKDGKKTWFKAHTADCAYKCARIAPGGAARR